jgi:predicted ABC-type ATPase
MPHVVVIAGPNGAGKSTVAPALLAEHLGIGEFVNADQIARGLSAFDPEGAAILAGRVMLARLRELAARRADFAFETTLASRSFAPWLAELRGTGYRLTLLYVWVPHPSLSVARVARRVGAGGHHVPSDVVRRRYYGGLRNFFTLYRRLADIWKVYDNSGQSGHRLVARGAGDAAVLVQMPATWETIRRLGGDDPREQRRD